MQTRRRDLSKDAGTHRTDTPLNPNIEPATESRLFDPSNPDHPPMPQDDPASHKFMQSVVMVRGPAEWQKSGQPDTAPDHAWKQFYQRKWRFDFGPQIRRSSRFDELA